MTTAARKLKTVTVPLESVTATFYVRKELNQDRVSQLISLVQAGETLPNITAWHNTVKDRYELIDGRHRVEAYTRMEAPTVTVDVVEEEDYASRVALAVLSNEGGSLTPTDDDYRHALKAMMSNGVSRKHILEVFPLPKPYTLNLIHQVESQLHRVTVNRAVNEVANHGLTVAQAATKYSIDASDIRERINPKKKRTAKVAISDFTASFNTRFRGISSGNSADYRKLIDAHDSGQLTDEDVRKVYLFVERKFKNGLAVLEDWKARFAVKIQEGKIDSETYTGRPKDEDEEARTTA